MRQLIEHTIFVGDYHPYARRNGWILRRGERRGYGMYRRAIRIWGVSKLLSRWRRWRDGCRWEE